MSVDTSTLTRSEVLARLEKFGDFHAKSKTEQLRKLLSNKLQENHGIHQYINSVSKDDIIDLATRFEIGGKVKTRLSKIKPQLVM